MKYFIKDYDTRYFAGIEFPEGVRLQTDDNKKIPDLWDKFFNKYNQTIDGQVEPNHYIGLECYPFDFMESKVFDYFVLAETKDLLEINDELVTKKLKKGRYICFPIRFDQITSEIKKVYEFIKKENIKVHMGFDYEDYIPEENYSEPEAILNFCFLLDEE